MKVTRILATSFLFAGTLFVAGNAYADGALRLSWGTCDPIVANQQFAPGLANFLVTSISGEDRQNRGCRVQVAIGPNLGDAWRFDADGCNTGQLSLNTAGLNKACPAFQGGAPVPIVLYGHGVDGPGTATLDVLNAYNSVTAPDPATRYTLAQALFNHTFSEAGPQNPAVACGNADQPLCFALTYTEYLNPDLSSDVFGIENDYVTWNDPANTTGCPSGTQNETTTWGRVKGLYR